LFSESVEVMIWVFVGGDTNKGKNRQKALAGAIPSLGRVEGGVWPITFKRNPATAHFSRTPPRGGS